MGNWAETTAKSDEILFDGKSLWLIPNRADKLLKISRDTADLTTHTITETYHTTEDDQLRDPTTTQAEERSTYTKTAPTIPGYTCIGHRIDGGVQRSGDTATIEDVTGDHTVLFLYHKDDEGGGTDPGGDGCCCCCCKPNVNIYDNVFTVNVDSIENLNLFGCGSECCDTDCE